MNPLAVIQDHAAEIRTLGARRIGVFGSFARGEARDDSDIDIFIEFEDPKRTYDNFFAPARSARDFARPSRRSRD